MPLTVASANVNGLRAAVRRGFHPWLDSMQPDVLTLKRSVAPTSSSSSCWARAGT